MMTPDIPEVSTSSAMYSTANQRIDRSISIGVNRNQMMQVTSFRGAQTRQMASRPKMTVDEPSIAIGCSLGTSS